MGVLKAKGKMIAHYARSIIFHLEKRLIGLTSSAIKRSWLFWSIMKIARKDKY
jgi:hypothetical protein